MPEDSLTTDFIATMPASYAQAFDVAEAREHALIVGRRGGSAAQVEVWRTLPQGAAILCVVADDRPGLVALVSAAFLAHALDVRSAQIYCRDAGAGRLEAVDFFWLRSVSPGTPLDPARLSACARTIVELLGADSERAEPLGAGGGADDAATLTFSADSAAPGRFEVVLEARDFPGLLHTVARLLHRHGLEVVRCEIRTDGGMARDRFWVTSFDGGDTPAQLEAFRAALLGVVTAIHKS